MQKTFSHKDLIFEIKIEIDSRIEKKLNGKRESHLTINGINNTVYHKSMWALTKDVAAAANILESSARVFAEEAYTGMNWKVINTLREMGYEKA